MGVSRAAANRRGAPPPQTPGRTVHDHTGGGGARAALQHPHARLAALAPDPTPRAAPLGKGPRVPPSTAHRASLSPTAALPSQQLGGAASGRHADPLERPRRGAARGLVRRALLRRRQGDGRAQQRQQVGLLHCRVRRGAPTRPQP
eukprot:6949398-Prymnesium_polylepis.1